MTAPSSSAAARPPSRAAGAKTARAGAACTYHVAIASPSPSLAVRVQVRCEGGITTGFGLAEPKAGRFVSTPEGLTPRFPLAARFPAAGSAELAYSVDLDGLARAEDDSDVARRFGASVVAPASSFLLQAEPPEDGIPTRVYFDSPGIESGLRRSGDAYVLESHELKVATYTAFGAREARDIQVGDATVRLAVLDGRLDLSMDELAHWVADAAGGVAAFYGRPPEARTLVVLAPIPDAHGIPFGKLLPESGPGLIVVVGEHTRREELHADWVLVHELFHVGTPSFLGEGKWYDEGLATYFEPLIRARLGWLREAELWHEFLRNMPRGLPALTERGLEHPRGYADMYWGGGLLCLLADVRARRASGGARGLEDGVRAVFEAGGVSSEVWTLAQTTEVTDRALGSPILAELEAAHLAQGAAVDIAGLFAELGVALGPKGGVVFDDKAPLAGLRHALAYGASR